MMAEQVMIIGAGPAGLTAAIQLKRYGIDPLIFEAGAVGGLLRNANLVENYPGFPRGITGTRLVNLFIRQAQNLNIEVIHEEVLELDHEDDTFEARTVHKTHYSRVAVIATGTKPCRLQNITLSDAVADRIFYEVCDLLQLKDKSVAIIGSGDAAFDYALNLGKKNRVIILNRSENPKCLPLLWERAQIVSTIDYQNNIQVDRLSKDSLGGILVDCHSRAGGLQFHADYLVGAIGREPRLDFLSESMLQRASLLEEQGTLYRIGDVVNGLFRQTSIAVGEGVLAAMKICRKLLEQS